MSYVEFGRFLNQQGSLPHMPSELYVWWRIYLMDDNFLKEMQVIEDFYQI